MITIEDLINKIKWDNREDPADYLLFYLDRITKKLVEIRYKDILRVEDGFIVLEREGEETNIPLHRIRKVTKKGEIVWQRI
ncbi:DUF504 domain-containing protein [Candidatus Woesearchaeota archaeon]|jgi:uncharacterized protein (UPF0248 family)|nr:DUF504 domain-containing protein [Candidatus Woesearchaeota archaeon]